MFSMLACIKRPALLLAFCCMAGCAGEESPVQLRGAIFGTTWSLTYNQAPEGVTPSQVKAEIEAAFALVNQSMNHYDPESLISQFNVLDKDAPLEVDWDFAYVLSAALSLNEITGGAYDVTVSALSDLWGLVLLGRDAFLRRPRWMPSKKPWVRDSWTGTPRRGS